MKILQCMSSVDPRRGGPSTAVRAMSASLVQQGHEVTILAHSDSSGESSDDFDRGYRLIRFPMTFKPWQYSWQYHRWLKKHAKDYDLIVITSLFLAHTFLASRIANRQGIPFVIRPHGILNQADLSRRKPLLKKLYLRCVDEFALRRAEFVFCTSVAEAEQASSPGRNVRVIPLGVDAPGEGYERKASSAERRRIVFVGRVTEKKGIDLLIAAYEKVWRKEPGASLLIAGPDDENLLTGYLSRVSEPGLKIDVVDFVSPAERSAIFGEAGVFVLPSADENFGIAVAEAMAASLPVIVTEGVSHANLVRKYGAGLVTDRNPDDIAEAINFIINLSTEKYHGMSAAARALAEGEFSWDKTAKALVESRG